MSQLNVDTLKDRLGADQPDIVGAAKAWVNFNGTGTVAIRDDFNVDSITDNGTGDYTLNFTTAFASANYSFQCTSILSNGYTSNIRTAPATTSLRVGTYNIGTSSTDAEFVSTLIHSN